MLVIVGNKVVQVIKSALFVKVDNPTTENSVSDGSIADIYMSAVPKL